MEQQEQVEWDDVNKLLQRHGFKPVHFADPVENKNLSDLVLLGKCSAGEIRATLRTMLADSERRQALIQELIKSNKQLKEEVQEHMSGAARQSQRATELEKLLDDVKIKVQELEERYLGEVVQHGSRMQQLEQEKQAAQKRREAVELKLSREKEKSAELQRKLYFTVKEEERQRECRSQTFQLLGERMSRHKPAADQDVLDVMMAYEAEVTRLNDELRSIRGDCDPGQTKRTTNGASSSFQTILKVYEEQRKESRGQIEDLKKEVEQLKQELQTESSRNERRSVPAHLCARYHHLLTEVSALVTEPGAPPGRHRQKTAAGSPGATEFDGVLHRLEVWSQQLHLLKELRRGLWRLAARLVPGELYDGIHDVAEGVKVEEMVLLVDTMLEKSCIPTGDDEKVLRSPTRYTLGSMVSHFQRLFDVSSLSGVYPRMNEVYTRLAEMSTSMKNLREVLGLDSRASPAQVVQQVTQLASSGGQRSKADQMLEDADIDSILIKVKQYEEFFPPFQTLMMDMFQILGVSSLDDVLPAVKTLKQSVH